MSNNESLKYTKDELVEMVCLIYEVKEDCAKASRVYRERHPERHYPDEHGLRLLKEKFEKSGCVFNSGIEDGGTSKKRRN